MNFDDFKRRTRNFSFYSDEADVSMNVTQEEFFSCLDLAISKNADAVLTIDHEYPHVAVWSFAVVGKADFVSLARGIDDEVLIQVKEEAAFERSVNCFSSLRLRS